MNWNTSMHKSAALAPDWWKKWPTHIRETLPYIFKHWTPHKTTLGGIIPNPGRYNPTDEPFSLGGLTYGHIRFQNGGNYTGNTCVMFMTAHNYGYTVRIDIILQGKGQDITMTGQKLMVLRQHCQLGEQPLQIGQQDFGAESKVLDVFKAIKTIITADNPPPCGGNDNDDDDPDDEPKDNGPRKWTYWDDDDGGLQAPQEQEQMQQGRQLALAGFNWYETLKISARQEPVFDFSVGIHNVRIGNCNIVYQVNENKIVDLASVRVPQRLRGKGDAKAALAHFTKALDQNGLHSKLLASPLDKKTRTHKLVALYGQFGYQYQGRIGNPAGDPELIRSPDESQQVTKSAQNENPLDAPEQDEKPPLPKSVDEFDNIDPHQFVPRKDINAEFWANPPEVLFHGTNRQNIGDIMKTGLKMLCIKRGPLDKRECAIFTSPRMDIPDILGSSTVKIFPRKMKAAGYMPRVTREEQIDKQDAYEELAKQMGQPYKRYLQPQQGYEPDTVVFYGAIPPKFLGFAPMDANGSEILDLNGEWIKTNPDGTLTMWQSEEPGVFTNKPQPNTRPVKIKPNRLTLYDADRDGQVWMMRA